MAFNDKYNTDNVFMRVIMVGLIDLLNRRVAIEQTVDDDDVRLIYIPFYPNQIGQDRFMQDFFMYYRPDCETGYAEGNYDQVPRGVITLNSFSINSAALTNKFTRGTFNREVDDTVQAFSDYINVIPLTISYELEIIAGTVIEAYKIVQEVISVFYKAASINVDYKGMRVPALVGFAQDYTINKPTTFTYGDDDRITVTFPIELETYMPVMGDPFSQTVRTKTSTAGSSSEMPRGKTMYHGIGNVVYSVSGVSGVYAKFEADVDPKMSEDKQDDPPANTPTPPQIDP